MAQAYNRAGNALQNIAGRFPGGGRLSQIATLKEDINDLTTASRAAGGGLAGLPVGLTAASVAAVGLTTALGAAISATVSLTREASDAGSAIFEAGQRTNITAESLSVLKIQAEQAGSTFDKITNSTTKFGNSLVDAARGDAQLRADLKLFGIDAETAFRRPEKTLLAFIDSFNKLPPSAVRNEAAMRLFKDRTGEVIPVLASMEGGFDAAREATERMGALWTGETAAAADRLGDKFTELQQMAQSAAYEFARGAMPEMEKALDRVTGQLDQGSNYWASWGKTAAGAINDILASLPMLEAGLYNSVGGLIQLLRLYGNIRGEMAASGGGATGPAGSFEVPQGVDPAEYYRLKAYESQGYSQPSWEMPALSVPRAGGGGKRGGGGRSRARDTSGLSDALWEGQEDITKQFDDALKLTADLERQFETFGDRTHRTALETRFLKGEFEYLNEEMRAGMLQKAALLDAAEGWEKFTTSAEETRKGLDELLGIAREPNPFENFQKSYDDLMHSIVGTKNFIDPAKEALIEIARQASISASMLKIAADTIGPAGPTGALPTADGAVARADTFDPSPDPLIRRDAMRQRLEEMADDIRYTLGGAFQQIFEGDFRGGLTSMITGFREAITRMAADLLASQLRSLLVSLIGKFVGGLFGGIGGGGGGSNSLGLLGQGGVTIGSGSRFGFFADGGFLPPGQWGIAGERGPEPIFGGRTGLTVIPNEKTRGGGPTTVNNISIALPPTPAAPFTPRRSQREVAEMLASTLSRRLN